MTSPRRLPIFDGHNDVLLRLYRRGGTDAPRAFLEGEGKGQLDLPMARQGGFAGGLFAIFVPSGNRAVGPNDAAPSPNVGSGAPLPPTVELMASRCETWRCSTQDWQGMVERRHSEYCRIPPLPLPRRS
jgi:membrane dipeptidase